MVAVLCQQRGVDPGRDKATRRGPGRYAPEEEGRPHQWDRPHRWHNDR